ncbi:MAG: tRNA (adenosine(37)-N6)-dimethylallyltransferase MiaA, partial [Gemmatimonadetes bacterium]|nr:tRNA (adenosine(37)-N6)-dimethylallyltransferase MiaA [Gemmatimonadota bacterium]
RPWPPHGGPPLDRGAGSEIRAVTASFLAIVGPTASGKSELAVALAQRLGGEVVSMDSRQVYRGMDIGTAKMTVAERAGIPHHGLDLVDPDQSYSAGRFAREARGWTRAIRERGRVPILVGGTGFFLRALTQPIFEEPALDPARRGLLRDWLAARPRTELVRWTRALDPARAEVAEAGGTQRLSRTLEVALLTGRALSWWHRSAPSSEGALSPMIALVELPREEIDRRIDARVERMLAGGLVEEVRGLLAQGYGPGDPGMTGVGYREIVAQLRGDVEPDQAAERTRKATRAYARRQETWFRHQLEKAVLRLDGMSPLEERVERVERAWTGAWNGGSDA